jgi:hypothetical protein
MLDRTVKGNEYGKDYNFGNEIISVLSNPTSVIRQKVSL